MGLFQQSLQGIVSGSGGVNVGTSANAKPVSHIDVLKAVKEPQALKDREGWERFSFQVETYLALMDPEFFDELEMARAATGS